MTREVISCFDDQDISDAAHVMETHKLRRLVVYDRMKKIAGVLTVADLATKARHDRLAARVLRHVCVPSQAHAATP
jgi:CBS-domain-containing membrane protein